MDSRLSLALVKIFEFPFVYSYFLPILLGIFLWKNNYLNRPAKYLVVYSILIFLEEYFYGVFGVLWRNNLWIGRIGLYIELLFVFFFFKCFITHKRLLHLMQAITIICIGLMTYLNTKAVWMSNPDVELIVYYTYLFIIVSLYYFQIFNDEKISNLFKDLGFMVGAVLILSNSMVLLFFLFYNYNVQTNDPELQRTHELFSYLNLIKIVGYNVFYAVFLWVTRVSPK